MLALSIDSGFQIVQHLESIPLSYYSQMLLWSIWVYLFIFWAQGWASVFIYFVFYFALHTFFLFDTNFSLCAEFYIIDHNIDHHMENIKIFWTCLYMEISFINYGSIVLPLFSLFLLAMKGLVEYRQQSFLVLCRHDSGYCQSL